MDFFGGPFSYALLKVWSRHTFVVEPVLMELWLQTVVAYEGNDLEALTDCEALVNEALEQLGIGELSIDIPDIEERIGRLQTEIVEIRENDPYQYRYQDSPDRYATSQRRTCFLQGLWRLSSYLLL